MGMGTVLAWIFTILICLSVYLMVTGEVDRQIDMLTYCENKGYDGVQSKTVLPPRDGPVCYKEVSHESGIGITYEYSGIIPEKVYK